MQQQFSKMLLDMIPVIMGILIALMINNWQERVKNERFIKKIFTAISQEIDDTRKNLEKTLELQKVFLDSLEASFEKDTISIADIAIQTGGIKVPTVQNTAWQALTNSKIELIDYELITLLTQIDEQKNLANLKISKLLDLALLSAEQTDIKSKKLLYYQLMNLMETTAGLLGAHEYYLEEYQ